MIKGLVDRLRGTAEALGCTRQLERVRTMADGPGGAERQLAVFERTGDLAAVARHMTGILESPGYPDPVLRDGAGPVVDDPGARTIPMPGAVVIPRFHFPVAVG